MELANSVILMYEKHFSRLVSFFLSVFNYAAVFHKNA